MKTIGAYYAGIREADLKTLRKIENLVVYKDNNIALFIRDFKNKETKETEFKFVIGFVKEYEGGNQGVLGERIIVCNQTYSSMKKAIADVKNFSISKMQLRPMIYDYAIQSNYDKISISINKTDGFVINFVDCSHTLINYGEVKINWNDYNENTDELLNDYWKLQLVFNDSFLLLSIDFENSTETETKYTISLHPKYNGDIVDYMIFKRNNLSESNLLRLILKPDNMDNKIILNDLDLDYTLSARNNMYLGIDNVSNENKNVIIEKDIQIKNVVYVLINEMSDKPLEGSILIMKKYLRDLYIIY